MTLLNTFITVYYDLMTHRVSTNTIIIKIDYFLLTKRPNKAYINVSMC